jgi:Zn-dependent peptidase ImmA (M78 family)/DNA-binding XRE family transcriptional regulator
MKSSVIMGDRILLARRKKGLSLRDLAAALDGMVSAQALGKYERGEMAPGSRVLLALTRVLDVSLNYLMAPQQARLGSIEFRKKAKTSAKDRARVESEVLETVERYLQIEKILGLSSEYWEQPFEPEHITCSEKAEGVASRVRVAWDLGLVPIRNLIEVLEEKGIKVLLLPLPLDVSGLTCIVHRDDEPDVPVIVVNQNYPLERRRYTLAHELGHRLMVCAEDIAEKAPNRFAGAFLMPADQLIKEVGVGRNSVSYREIMELKRLFRVSASALWVRFYQLGVIDQNTYQYAFRTFARTWRSTEPEPLEARQQKFERVQRFKRLCLRALAEGLISLAKASELLKMPVKDIELEWKGPD